MTFRELKKISHSHYYCLFLDKYFPKVLRKILKSVTSLLAVISFVLSFNSLPLYFSLADSLFFIFIFIFLNLSFLEFFYRSMMNEGLKARIPEKLLDKNINIDYSLSGILFATDEIDVTRAFFETKVGTEILIKSGVSKKDFKDFIYSKRTPIIASTLNFESGDMNIFIYADIVYETDKSLQAFLSQNSINKSKFMGAAHWVMDIEEKKRRKERFWSRENLGAIPSIVWLCGF